jgi:CDP-paratose 2-epimerase
MKKNLIVTGSSGLVGSEIVDLLSKDFNHVFGIDNNLRKYFFGNQGDVKHRERSLKKKIKNYTHFNLDIRERNKIFNLVKKIKPFAIIHCAGQPSHDLAAKIPFDDFETNANGTLNLLEAVRRYSKKTIFIFLSTNKVYGDNPNKLELNELKTRYEYKNKDFKKGINEKLSIDQNTHSIFGASKLSADILVQEYGRYFDILTCCLRAGCITGPNHAGVELHGFLNYLIKCNVNKTMYSIYGYKGKQVRDNIHAYDLAQFIRLFLEKPRKAEVYNIGGGKNNSISILEAFNKIANLSGIKMISEYKKKARVGDHICYYSDLTKIKKHYPSWHIEKKLDNIFEEILQRYL